MSMQEEEKQIYKYLACM